jgi:hypothetical protein
MSDIDWQLLKSYRGCEKHLATVVKINRQAH